MGLRLRGKIRGRLVELESETGLPEGTEVTVEIEPIEKVDDAFFGIWRDREDMKSGPEWVDKIRGEWRRAF